ncbi:MAG TPA: CpsD/CapB family tyrosine-protein kinase, partial [Methylomirabilota bacterium]|nr:CpsD/CapB family tyrosine-protein kinase [Methylomirabilota bacterium]
AATAAPPARVTAPPAPAADRAPVYGAPVARQGAPGRRGFGWTLRDEAAAREAGEIDDHLVSLLAPTSFAAEQYRAVRLAVERFRHERGTRVVAVSSPGRGEGRTTTAINLAGALAQAPDAHVALVDADLRHPGVAGLLGLPAGRGLSGYLHDSAVAVDAVLARPAGIAFTVVSAGATPSMPYELLKSPRLAGLLAALRERYDYVVLDTPPVLPFPDVGILRDAVDGFVLVVRAQRTPREMLRDSVGVVGRDRALGVVFNDDERNAVDTLAQEAEGGWRRYVPRPLGGARVA